MKTVYIETSIISYLTALPARDLLAAAWQKATSRWWELQRQHFELFTSQLVIDEAGKGHACPEICTPLQLMGEDDER